MAVCIGGNCFPAGRLLRQGGGTVTTCCCHALPVVGAVLCPRTGSGTGRDAHPGWICFKGHGGPGPGLDPRKK